MRSSSKRLEPQPAYRQLRSGRRDGKAKRVQDLRLNRPTKVAWSLHAYSWNRVHVLSHSKIRLYSSRLQRHAIGQGGRIAHLPNGEGTSLKGGLFLTCALGYCGNQFVTVIGVYGGGGLGAG